MGIILLMALSFAAVMRFIGLPEVPYDVYSISVIVSFLLILFGLFANIRREMRKK
jgi:hypothetical protein